MTPREARLARGFTQAFVAFKSKVSAKTIHHAERTGLWPRSLSVRRRYGRTLKVPLKAMEIQPPWSEQIGGCPVDDLLETHATPTEAQHPAPVSEAAQEAP